MTRGLRNRWWKWIILTSSLLLTTPSVLAESASTSYAYQAGTDGEASHEHLGITVSASPFLSGKEREGAVTGFWISVEYREIGTVYREKWVDRSFISIHHLSPRVYGPFRNVRGANFKIRVLIRQSGADFGVEFGFACDDLELEKRYHDAYGKPGVELVYERFDYPGVREIKEAYAIYSTVSLIYDLAKLTTGAIGMGAFLVNVVVDVTIQASLSLIPDYYEDAVGYECTLCGEYHPLSRMRGCTVLECCDGWVRARVCRVD